MYTYEPKGVCSRRITFDIKNNVIQNVHFLGGCDGNLQGLSKLIEGMDPTDVIKKLSGIKCGNKNTSCPDQLATALKQAIS